MIRTGCEGLSTPWRWTFLAVGILVMAAPAGAQQAVASPHGPLPLGVHCSACHTAQGWNTLREPLGFEHGAASGFVISGAHAQAKCASCHLDLRFDGPDLTMSDCASCHSDIHDGRMLQSCAACHTPTSFADVDGELIHTRTSFPLTGAHRQVTCESCHTNDQGGAYSRRDTECSSCHLQEYQSAATVDHVQGGYPTDCTQCHSTLSWGDTPAFDHVGVSGGFELVGAHDQLRCASCHALPGMVPIFPAADQNDCVACHQVDYDREHGGSGIPTTCTTCHTVDSWDDADFDHALTGFALVGDHRELQCSSCHTDGQQGLKFPVPTGQNDCVACHQSDYDKEHQGSGYPTTCLSCHTQPGWGGAAFSHGTTAFPLVGAHTAATCADCHGPPAHLSSLFQGAESCVSCHQIDYDQNHAGSGFPSTCLACHTQTTWSGAVVDHAALGNGFTLSGPHAAATCESCHTVPDYGLKFTTPATGEDCAACHQTEYDANHAGSNFPLTCLSCHAADRWDGAVFDHAGSTGFALVGPHAAAPCESCHTVPDYGLKFTTPATGEDCAACHQTEYDANHSGSGFPTTCLNCHGQSTWQGAVFDHGTSTGFALEGPHVPLDCSTCHAVPGYALLFPKPATGDDCVACHQGQYDANHSGSSFPTTCLACHQRTTWSGATVDHVTIGNGFALVGAHASTTCAACHAIPGYSLIFPKPSSPNDCVACHQVDYFSAHGASGYPTDCSACHTVDAWKPSTFNHDSQYFPIYSGKHREAWKSCADCHTSPLNLGVYSCLTCHEHSKASMDDKHKEQAGYAYVSSSCLACHPTGRSD